jgi:hypothetical protein
MVALHEAVNTAAAPPTLGVHLKIPLNLVAVVEPVTAVTNLAAACLLRRHHLAGLSEVVDIAKTHPA